MILLNVAFKIIKFIIVFNIISQSIIWMVINVKLSRN